jgi:hypothetical protein
MGYVRLWRDKWAVRRLWKTRLALILMSFACLAWYWTSGAPFWAFALAVGTPIVVNLAFWQSDERAEKERKARLASGV